MTSIKHLIHGEHVADDARTTDVFNPSTGQAIHKLGLASRATVQKAIESAQAAFPAWRNTPPAKRAQVMFRFKQLLGLMSFVSPSSSVKSTVRLSKMPSASLSVVLTT